MDNKLIKEIKLMRRNGMKDEEIANVLGISKSTISYNCPKRGARKSSALRKAKARELAMSGMKLMDVADELGIARSTVYLWFASDKEILSLEKPKFVCPVCGKEFAQRVKTQKYCSDRCDRKANKKTSEQLRRIRKKSQIVDKDITLESLYRRDSGVCHICGLKCNLEDYIIRDGRKIVGEWYPSIDHVKPLCQGGLHAWNNVKIAHRKCNSWKSTRDRDERFTMGEEN